MKNKLRYSAPAKSWEQGMPIGNGRIGAMLLGGVQQERIWLNEDTLWSGYPADYNDPEVYPYLKEARELIFAKEYKKAEDVINQHMVGVWNESYMPMADLWIRFPKTDQVKAYERELDISRGISRVFVETEDNRYERTAFCSFPDQVLALHIKMQKPIREEIEILLKSQLRHFYLEEKEELCLNSWCPSLVEPDYYPAEDPVIYEPYETTRAIKFQVRIKVITDGKVIYGPSDTSQHMSQEKECHAERDRNDSIRIRDTDEILVLITSADSFLGYDSQPAGDFERLCRQYLKKAASYSYEELKIRHERDFASLFDRVEVDFGHGENERLPMEERHQKYFDGAFDPELAATAFQFGRYLLISSSREGTEPANLQGIWNNQVRPPWSSNYTVNINTQMNYWPVDTVNLSECGEPLYRFLKEIAKTGRETAKVNYHCRGWVAHHNIDLWRKTTAVGSRKKEIDVLPWSFWVMSGGWFCRQLWEHYRYTKDIDFLRETAYPIMAEAARFYLDFLVEHQGELVICPSTSPENSFLCQGEPHGVTYGSTLDTAILRDLFGECLEAIEALSLSQREFQKELKEALSKLPKYQIGSWGQLQEWREDFEEADPEHRHLSLLYGFYPSEQITLEKMPKLSEACRITMKRRGEGGVPWSRAWKIGIFARFKDGEKAHQEVKRFLQPADSKEISYTEGGVYHNLFCARPLEVDGNLGFTAGVAEMLVQSHLEEPEFLPALPKEWKDGYAKGLCIRGGNQADIYWKDGKITKTRIYPARS